jgi:hypothetical protein
MRLARILSKLEDDDAMHLARLLVLLRAFTGQYENKPVSGITKLVKLDFLLRYPIYLERALHYVGASVVDVRVLEHERKSVESSMIRYHYGPWDPRYRRFINLLVGKGLAKVYFQGYTVKIALTEKGNQKANAISNDENFEAIAYRAEILKKYFDFRATRLKDFIYEAFPEILSLRLGEEIKLEH